MALALLIAACVGLLEYQGHLPGSRDNERTQRLERLGSQAVSGWNNLVAAGDNSVVLASAGAGRSASAEWSMSSYEFAHILPRSASCSMQLYAMGPNVWATEPGAWVELALNGERIALLRFRGSAPDFPVGAGRLAPAGTRPAQIRMTPLFNPYGLVFPVSPAACRAGRWDVRVTVHEATWPLDRLGMIANFSPVDRTLAAPGVAALVVALLLVGGLLVGTHLFFNAVVKNYGPLALLLVLFIFACALVTHDEWDFAVWLRFADLVSFGGGNPAYMWAGTPLWPFLTALAAPVLSATYFWTGDASQESAALFFKLAMALAACANAFFLAQNAPRRLRRFLFPIFLLSPLSLYELGGGYRELFAGSCVLLGCSLSIRSRYAPAAFVFSLAASISESLLPLVLLPVSLHLTDRGPGGRRLALAALDIFAGIAPLAFQWFFLIPHSVVTAAVGTRIEAAYRYGGGSWYASLDGFGLLPKWVGQHSLAVVGGIFVVLAAPLAFRLGREMFAARKRPGLAQKAIFGIFVGFVAAFFLAYRGVDPATWYALFAIAAFYFVRFEPTNPFPLFLSALAGFAFYAILGFGDFANWTYLMPQNRSLLGVLGTPMLVAVLAVNLSVGALYLSCLAGDASLLFGRGSSWFLMLLFGAAATSAIRLYPLDVALCFAGAALVTIAFHRLTRLDEISHRWKRRAAMDYVGLGACIASGAWAGSHNGAAALVAFIALLLGVAYGFGMCDIVLGVTSVLLLAAQPGSGWVSIAGFCILAVLTLAAVRKAQAAYGGTVLAARSRDIRFQG